MMITRVLVAALALSAIGPGGFAAQTQQQPLPIEAQSLPELLIPARQDVIDRLLQPHNFGLRQSIHNAVPSRYRIVTIDFDVLNQENGMFTITLLPGEQITVRALEVIRSSGADMTWKGEVLGRTHLGAATGRPVDTEPIEIRVGMTGVPISPTLQKQLASERKNVSRDAEAIPPLMAVRTRIAGSPESVSRLEVKMQAKYLIAHIVQRGRQPSRINISPIADDPRYHVVIELDPSKQIWESTDRARIERSKAFQRELDVERKQFQQQEREQFKDDPEVLK